MKPHRPEGRWVFVESFYLMPNQAPLVGAGAEAADSSDLLYQSTLPGFTVIPISKSLLAINESGPS